MEMILSHCVFVCTVGFIAPSECLQFNSTFLWKHQSLKFQHVQQLCWRQMIISKKTGYRGRFWNANGPWFTTQWYDFGLNEARPLLGKKNYLLSCIHATVREDTWHFFPDTQQADILTHSGNVSKSLKNLVTFFPSCHEHVFGCWEQMCHSCKDTGCYLIINCQTSMLTHRGNGDPKI